ncbi:MAG: FGGY-family carbohydrate kinase [Pseudomonadota bacterium]
MTGLSLGIDIGTSGIRTAVLDESGALLSTARAPHEPQDTKHIDAMAWWRAVQSCIASQGIALQKIGHSLGDVAHIGVDGTSGTMVLTDANLKPVTCALMYNSTGFDSEAKRIAQHAPEVHITQGSNSALARALRLQSQDTEKHASHLLHQADFVIAKLRGTGGVSDHNNTLKLGFDPETGTWPDWFAQTGFDLSLLPKVEPAGAPIGPIAPDMAKQLGFSPAAIVHTGTTDSIAAFLAAAPLVSGAAVTSLGTTLAIKLLSETRIDDPSVGLYAHKLGRFWLVGGASNSGGGVLAQLFTPQDLAKLSAQIDPTQPSPLNYYPLTKPGERFPVNDPNHAPVLTPRPDSDVAFLHGLLESIARIEAQCYKAIQNRGGSAPSQLFTAGGGAQNQIWTQIRARVLGIEPKEADQSEAAIGIARLILDL